MARIMAIISLVMSLLGCAKDDVCRLHDFRALPGTGVVAIGSISGEAVVVRGSDGEVLLGLTRGKGEMAERRTVDPVVIRRAASGYWYSYRNALYGIDDSAMKIERRVQVFPKNSSAMQDVISLFDANGAEFILATTNSSLFYYNDARSTTSLIIQGQAILGGYWETRMLPGERAVTVSNMSCTEHSHWTENPRGLTYFTYPDYQSGVSIWDLTTAKRLFRVDVDGKMEVSGRTFLWYESPNLLHGAGWDDPLYLWTLDMDQWKVTKLRSIITRGPFVVHGDKVLEARREEGIELVAANPCDTTTFTSTTYTQLKFGFPPGSTKIIGLAWDEKSQTCVAYDSTGGLFGVKVDWERNTLKKVWSLSAWQWRRKLKLLPHLREGAVLPPLEIPKYVDLEAPLRAPVPEEYTPGEPAPDIWAREEQKAFEALTGPNQGPDAIDFESWIRKFRSREFALKWAEKHDRKFYEQLMDEGPEGWEAWRKQNMSEEERFAKQLLGKP